MELPIPLIVKPDEMLNLPLCGSLVTRNHEGYGSVHVHAELAGARIYDEFTYSDDVVLRSVSREVEQGRRKSAFA